MAVTVPLELPEQLALERATHAVLDVDHAGDLRRVLQRSNVPDGSGPDQPQ